MNAPFLGEDMVHDFWCRSLWDWAVACLQNKNLVDKFRWDAEKLEQWDGRKWERFVDDPWTGDDWFRIQASSSRTARSLDSADVQTGRTHFQRVVFPSLLSSTPTKPCSRLLVLKKGIQYMPNSPICRPKCGMAKVWVEAGSSGGFLW